MMGFVMTGGLMYFWPGYSESELLNLTPEQVVSRLGEPTTDPRRFGWDENRDGPLHFHYDWNWTTTVITFKNGHASSVQQRGK